MTAKGRRILLFCLLAASALPLFLDEGLPEAGEKAPYSVVGDIRRTAAQENPPPGVGSGILPPGPMLKEIKPRTGSGLAGDAFPIHTWSPVSHPAPAAGPGPRAEVGHPAAPPLPYAYLGKKYEDGAWLVFVSRDEQVHILKETDVLDGLYRIDAISPPTMTLTYLPTQQQQILAIGDTP